MGMHDDQWDCWPRSVFTESRRRRLLLGMGLFLSVLFVYQLQAQSVPRPETKVSTPTPPEHVAPTIETSSGSIQDALIRPYSFPFAEETTLDSVCKHLQKTLRCRVILDRAALDRSELKGSSTVTLQIDGVRLKTGLKLMLDQLGLTYRVIPEDNLLIITDLEGADDPIERLAREVKAVHDEVHDLQDAVAELHGILSPPAEEEANAQVRKPTIKEDVPGTESKAKSKEKPHEEGSPRSRPGF